MKKDRAKRRINNKDIPLLRSVLYVMQDIRALEERRERLKGRMVNITQHLSWARGGGTPRGLEEAFEQLSAVEDEHAEKIREYLDELKKAEKIINGIENRYMRTFVSMLYVEHIPGGKVREELNMTDWGFRRARESIERAEDMKSAVWSDRYIGDES